MLNMLIHDLRKKLLNFMRSTRRKDVMRKLVAENETGPISTCDRAAGSAGECEKSPPAFSCSLAEEDCCSPPGT